MPFKCSKPDFLFLKPNRSTYWSQLWHKDAHSAHKGDWHKKFGNMLIRFQMRMRNTNYSWKSTQQSNFDRVFLPAHSTNYVLSKSNWDHELYHFFVMQITSRIVSLSQYLGFP